MSSSSSGNQQSIEMRNRGAINKTSGTLMSFGAVHDKYTKGIDITQVQTHIHTHIYIYIYIKLL